jgi:hypothetical protein
MKNTRMARRSSTPTPRATTAAPPGRRWARGADPVGDRDVRRDALRDLLAGVGVDPLVRGQDPVEPVHQVDDEGDQATPGEQRVDAPQALAGARDDHHVGPFPAP